MYEVIILFVCFYATLPLVNGKTTHLLVIFLQVRAHVRTYILYFYYYFMLYEMVLVFVYSARPSF